jgi:C4-dicarboxylate-specific signal transduction histidine kinase/ABC-type uncharacterized transport system substrate-binding protein
MCALISLCATAMLPCVARAGAAPGVLIIHTNQRPTPAAAVIEERLRKVVPEALERAVDLYSEYLDIEWPSSSAYGDALAEFLSLKYAERDVRVIVAAAPQALRFAIGLRDTRFPGVPIVHIAIPQDQLAPLKLVPDIVGSSVDLDPTQTLELATRLQPDAKRFVFILGAAERDRLWERRLRAALGRIGPRIEPEFMVGLPTADVQRRVAALDPATIVFTPGYLVDGAGAVSTPRQSVEVIARASAAPVYAPLDTFLGSGIVGGYMAPYAEQATRASATIVRLLEGAAPSDIAPATVRNVPMVDWRALHRWKISERLLPDDAVVMFREPTAWDKYKLEISTGVAILLLQAALIAALLFERRSRRRTAIALRESHEQMNLAARAARLSFWVWDAGRDKVRAIAHTRQLDASRNGRSIALRDFLESVHPADREDVGRAAGNALATGEELDVQYRLMGSNGDVRWMAARGRVEKGHAQRLIGVALDVTDRRVAELRAAEDRMSLRHMMRVSMVGQLSAAIAHQLNQPLAAILGNAEAAEKMLERPNADLEELREICGDIVDENHRAAEIIRRLRELYKRGDMKVEVIDLNALIRETLDLLHTELLIRRVAPITQLAPDLPQVDGGYVQLQQIVLNLVLNAADAMDGIVVNERRLKVRTEATDAAVRLYVVDNGSGIAATDAENVFEPFRSTKPGGMGIGLAICHSIVTAHRGRISAANNAEGGATFCVTLPIRYDA